MPPLISLSPTSTAITQGRGLFSTLYSDAGQVHYFNAHWQRLSQSAEVLALPLPDKIAVHKALAPLLSAPHPRAVRLSVYPEGFHLSTRPVPQRHPHPLHLALIPAKRGDNPLFQHKTNNYGENHYWLQEITAQGYDDGLFCHYRNHIQESPRANVFFIQGDTLLTPPSQDGVLPGIMRQQVLRLAYLNNWRTQIRSIPLAALAHMEAAFLTNSIRHIQPIGRIDNHNYLPHHPWIDYLQRQLNPPC